MDTTLKENKKGYTKSQFDQAKIYRKIYHNLGCPTVEKFKHILCQKMIKNFPATAEDVNIADRCFGLIWLHWK